VLGSRADEEGGEVQGTDAAVVIVADEQPLVDGVEAGALQTSRQDPSSRMSE
jgi:hypothetical protein